VGAEADDRFGASDLPPAVGQYAVVARSRVVERQRGRRVPVLDDEEQVAAGESDDQQNGASDGHEAQPAQGVISTTETCLPFGLRAEMGDHA
jgi:hypothetical protein